MIYTSSSASQTQQIAEEFAKRLTGGEWIGLVGDLGSGKTTFVQGLSRALGYEGPVRSPTFTIVNIYPTSHPSIKHIVHVDLYRVNHEIEVRALAFEEWAGRKDSVVLIEWSDKSPSLNQKCLIRISFAISSHDLRTIKIQSSALARDA